jgi:hypothetical protein
MSESNNASPLSEARVDAKFELVKPLLLTGGLPSRRPACFHRFGKFSPARGGKAASFLGRRFRG